MSSLEAVYEMTWAEFQIRLFAYKRMDNYEWLKQRELMWTCYIAPHQDPKKMIKRKEAFLPLNNDKKNSGGVSEEMKLIFLNEYKKWQQAVN
jgi:hypothetical protein